MDIHEIMKLLPHRYPFLLIDRVLEYKEGEHLVALKNVTINEPFFPGHFPQRPVMPGVLIMEAMAQATGLLAFVTDPDQVKGNSLYYFAGMDRVRFKRQVEPGDQLRLEVKLGRVVRGLWKFTGEAYVGEQLAASAELMGGNRTGDRGVIHQTAIIDPSANIAEGVEIGAYSVIGADVEIGPDCVIGPHVVINGPTRMGAENRIFQFASIGEAPQDKSYAGEPTRLEIGDRNVIREYATMNRGTEHGGGVTRVGNDNLFMAYTHLAHDCWVGNNTIFANAASLAGHVEVGDYSILGGFTNVHQFCKIGPHSFCGLGTTVLRDIPPYVIANGNPATPHGINSEGLKRRGFSKAAIQGLRKAYKLLYKSQLKLKEAETALIELQQECPEVGPMVEFLQKSERSIVR